jgi:hypothetical protein
MLRALGTRSGWYWAAQVTRCPGYLARYYLDVLVTEEEQFVSLPLYFKTQKVDASDPSPSEIHWPDGFLWFSSLTFADFISALQKQVNNYFRVRECVQLCLARVAQTSP